MSNFPRSFNEILAEVDSGRLIEDLSRQLAEVTNAAIATNKAGSVKLFHNEDGPSCERSEDCFLLHFEIEDGASFYAYTYAGELPGGSYNWNNHHLYFSVNFVATRNKDVRGRVSRVFVARLLLEASTIEEAVEILRSSPDASGYHYCIGQGDRIVSVENCRSEVSVKEIIGLDVHSNHYIHPIFAKEAPCSEHSKVRLDRARKLLEQGSDPINILADRGSAPFSICTRPQEVSSTLSTVVFAPDEGIVTIYEPETLGKLFEFKI